jgi:hypothetical protein
VKTRRKKARLLRDTFQYRIIAVSLFYQLVITMTFAAALFVPTMMQLDGSSPSSAEAQQAAVEFLVLHKRVWPALLVAIAGLVVHAVLFSHRIAGPLYRFRTIFKAVTEGKSYCVHEHSEGRLFEARGRMSSRDGRLASHEAHGDRNTA